MYREDYLSDINWRDTARPLRFFIFDARVLWVLLVWAFYMCVETFVLALLGMFIFGLVEFFGFTPAAALRAFKVWLFGNYYQVERHYLEYRRMQC